MSTQKDKNNVLNKEYSFEFDELRKNRIEISFYKYGASAINFGRRYVNALGSMTKCVEKYLETHNKEYLVDAANYLMFEYMFPYFDDAYFKATDSSESAGIDGISIKEIEQLKMEDI